MTARAFVLVTFPCGCIVDAQSSFTDCEHLVVECRWCGSTFLTSDLREWFRGETPPIYIERASLLACAGERLVEIVGWCEGCDLPLGRERGTSGRFHLNEETTPVRN